MKLRRKEPSGSSGRPPSSAARRGCRSRGSRTCRGLAGGDRPPGLGGAPGRPGRAGAFPIPGFRGVVPEEKGERAPAPFSTSGQQAPADAGADPFRPPRVEAGATEAGKHRADRRRKATPLVHSSRPEPLPTPGASGRSGRLARTVISPAAFSAGGRCRRSALRRSAPVDGLPPEPAAVEVADGVGRRHPDARPSKRSAPPLSAQKWVSPNCVDLGVSRHLSGAGAGAFPAVQELLRSRPLRPVRESATRTVRGAGHPARFPKSAATAAATAQSTRAPPAAATVRRCRSSDSTADSEFSLFAAVTASAGTRSKRPRCRRSADRADRSAASLSRILRRRRRSPDRSPRATHALNRATRAVSSCRASAATLLRYRVSRSGSRHGPRVARATTGRGFPGSAPPRTPPISYPRTPRLTLSRTTIGPSLPNPLDRAVSPGPLSERSISGLPQVDRRPLRARDPEPTRAAAHLRAHSRATPHSALRPPTASGSPSSRCSHHAYGFGNPSLSRA